MDSRRETPLNPITTLAFDWADTVMECGLDHHGPINHLTLIEAVPGVREAILEVQQDYFIVMATNAIEAGVDDIKRSLANGDMQELFSAIYTAKMLGYSKDNPAYYVSLAEEIGINPSEAIMIGNDYSRDVETAKIAGFNTIWFNPLRLPCPGGSHDAWIHCMQDLTLAVSEVVRRRVMLSEYQPNRIHRHV